MTSPPGWGATLADRCPRRPPLTGRLEHRDAKAALAGSLDGALIPGGRVADDAHPRVCGEHALEAGRRLRRSIRHDHHPRTEAVADPDPAAVVDAHPGGTRCRVDQGIEDRPVGDRIGAVAHRL